ncbi:MAG: hypothetical protein WCX73_05855 [Candidatus Pacearchaeota archaeon]|jgi:predicted amidophosphoribosyltransferase
MVHYEEESASYPESPYFIIKVYAPKFYLKGHRDEYSEKILESKKIDLSEYFREIMISMINNLVTENKIDSPNLIVIAPNSHGGYSPTLRSLGKLFATKFRGCKFEEVVISIDPQRKNVGSQDLNSRFNKVKGHFSLSRPLLNSEKKILVFDDTKVSGGSLLEIEKVLKDGGAEKVNHICLSISRNKDIFPL